MVGLALYTSVPYLRDIDSYEGYRERLGMSVKDLLEGDIEFIMPWERGWARLALLTLQDKTRPKTRVCLQRFLQQ